MECATRGVVEHDVLSPFGYMRKTSARAGVPHNHPPPTPSVYSVFEYKVYTDDVYTIYIYT